MWGENVPEKTFRHEKFIFRGGVFRCCSEANALWIYEKAFEFVGV
jgi:hypothetical protein